MTNVGRSYASSEKSCPRHEQYSSTDHINTQANIDKDGARKVKSGSFVGTEHYEHNGMSFVVMSDKYVDDILALLHRIFILLVS